MTMFICMCQYRLELVAEILNLASEMNIPVKSHGPLVLEGHALQYPCQYTVLSLWLRS